MEVSHSGQLHTLGKREPNGSTGSNPVTSALNKYISKVDCIYSTKWVGNEETHGSRW